MLYPALADGQLNLFILCSLFTTVRLLCTLARFHRWMHTILWEKNNWGTARGYRRRKRPSISEAEIDYIFLNHHRVPLKSPFSCKSVKQAHLFSFSIVSCKLLLALQGITWLRSENECFLCLLQMCLLEAHPSEHQRLFYCNSGIVGSALSNRIASPPRDLRA